MKKLTALMLAAAMSLALVSCGGNSQSTESTASGGASSGADQSGQLPYAG